MERCATSLRQIMIKLKNKNKLAYHNYYFRKARSKSIKFKEFEKTNLNCRIITNIINSINNLMYWISSFGSSCQTDENIISKIFDSSLAIGTFWVITITQEYFNPWNILSYLPKERGPLISLSIKEIQLTAPFI